MPQVTKHSANDGHLVRESVRHGLMLALLVCGLCSPVAAQQAAKIRLANTSDQAATIRDRTGKNVVIAPKSAANISVSKLPYTVTYWSGNPAVSWKTLSITRSGQYNFQYTGNQFALTSSRISISNPGTQAATVRSAAGKNIELAPNKSLSISATKYPYNLTYWSGKPSVGWKTVSIAQPGQYGMTFQGGEFSLAQRQPNPAARAVAGKNGRAAGGGAGRAGANPVAVNAGVANPAVANPGAANGGAANRAPANGGGGNRVANRTGGGNRGGRGPAGGGGQAGNGAGNAGNGGAVAGGVGNGADPLAGGPIAMIPVDNQALRMLLLGRVRPNRTNLLAAADDIKKLHENAVKEAAGADKTVQDEKLKQGVLETQLVKDNKALDDAAKKVAAAQNDLKAKKGKPGEAAAKAALAAAEKAQNDAKAKVAATNNAIAAAKTKVADSQKKANLAKAKANDALANRNAVCDKMVAFLLAQLRA